MEGRHGGVADPQRQLARDMGAVPAEFRGMARVFRAEMLECDFAYDRSAKAIIKPLEARLRRKPTLRREHVIDVVRGWKALPFAQYRLRPVEVVENKRELDISETRVAAGRVLNPEWASPELGVLITRVGLRVSDGRLSKSLRVSTVISGHALGRRFERVRVADRCTESVLADVGELVGRIDDVLGWRGQDFMADDAGQPRTTRDVRTWWWLD